MARTYLLSPLLLAGWLCAALPVTAQATELKVYAVTGTNGTSLNLRAAPGTSSKVVAKIPADSGGIVATGEERKVGNAIWAKVYWTDKGGWVNKTYLKLIELAPATPPKPDNKPKPSNPSGGGVALQCLGTEPFWNMVITERDIKVDMLDGPKYSVPVRLRQTSANNTTIAVIAGENTQQQTQAFLQKTGKCSDGMSDNVYPFSITALLNKSRVLSGCCTLQR